MRVITNCNILLKGSRDEKSKVVSIADPGPRLHKEEIGKSGTLL